MPNEKGLRARKSENFSEWFTQVIDKADLADTRYNVQGFIVHKTGSTRIIRQITRMFESELEKTGHEPVMFPLVIPEENLKKEGEHFGFVPEVFWVTEKGIGEKLEKKVALRPTSETAFYPMYSLWIRSYRDLPMRKYQAATMYRHEPVTRPFIRGREFIWVEAHDVFETHDESLRQMDADVENMRGVVEGRLGISTMIFKRPQWDKFLGAEDTIATDILMPDGKVLQVGSTHDLGQKFSVPFKISFIDKEEKERFAWQTCYGPGIWRIFAALVAVHGDDKGLVLPFEVAPTQIVIIPIPYGDKDRKAIDRKCGKLLADLSRSYRVSLDDSDKTPGEKYNSSELSGIPVRIEVGSKEAKGKFVTVYRRDRGTKEKVADKSLAKKIESLSGDILKSLRQRSAAHMEASVASVNNRHDLFRAARKGGFVRAPFCMTEGCAREIQNSTSGAKVRGTLFGKGERATGKCVYCSKSAKSVVYFAKQY